MASFDTVQALEDSSAGGMPPIITERDIVFACPACDGELVVDQDGIGITVPCPHCGNPLLIPEPPDGSAGSSHTGKSAASAPPPPAPIPTRQFDFSTQTQEHVQRRQSDLKHQLKENRSQDTEMRGHVNRATMELHRLQLRLKKLQERQADIEAELGAIENHLREQSGA